MKKPNQLIAHCFRNEYGKMISVITGYLGIEKVHTAEDIVQETLYRALQHWTFDGIPNNPEAWLYTTAKNLAINTVARSNNLQNIKSRLELEMGDVKPTDGIDFSEGEINDSQLKMMMACCHAELSEDNRLALILKILCGFSVKEIANAFFTNTETINKRLVRGRKKIRESSLDLDDLDKLEKHLDTMQQAIYLLFNEGYKSSQKNIQVRYDLCLEAVRLCELLANSKSIENKSEVYALLALMFLNASRFQARMNSENTIIELSQQDRNLWDKSMRYKGLQYLDWAIKDKKVSKYLILATISANHCVAPSYNKTNWVEILRLYDTLLELENSPVVRLNRAIAVSNVHGNQQAIFELESLKDDFLSHRNHLYHATLAALYGDEKDEKKAIKHYKEAIALASTEIDKEFLKKKWEALVPISNS
ncbi:RNA polymerase sigma factor [Flagellimonas meridianipacifica]|uniref:RNA polymerase sigma-70 factor (ECF subfamily) n=1 Tax=Flagellimonas meridianipacifica TaxID=1080225 RepID=A0A2T0MII4_9FLAO|nr:sigma-70 family RNA polymerase sigma factor [Allomuricauda pacifica]PRX57391.1 RNA polymerase sigma-70 factor (ECF subfamily) [Allomuricauda pacifica]